MSENPDEKEMTIAEITELMQLKGWNRTQLAQRLQLTQGAVTRWLAGEHAPAGPARILMRIWLEEARANPVMASSKRTA